MCSISVSGMPQQNVIGKHEVVDVAVESETILSREKLEFASDIRNE